MPDATMIVPIGAFTPDLSRRVRQTAFETAQQREVIISLQSTRRHTWEALADLSAALRSAITPYPIHLACGLPRTRALLRELGIEGGWFVDQNRLTCTTHILMRSRRRLRSAGAPRSDTV